MLLPCRCDDHQIETLSNVGKHIVAAAAITNDCIIATINIA